MIPIVCIYVYVCGGVGGSAGGGTGDDNGNGTGNDYSVSIDVEGTPTSTSTSRAHDTGLKQSTCVGVILADVYPEIQFFSSLNTLITITELLIFSC